MLAFADGRSLSIDPVPAQSFAATGSVLAPLRPSQRGDSTAVEIASGRLTARVATPYRRLGSPRALTTRPDVTVELKSDDFVAGRGPVLARALRRP